VLEKVQLSQFQRALEENNRARLFEAKKLMGPSAKESANRSTLSSRLQQLLSAKEGSYQLDLLTFTQLQFLVFFLLAL
jgi:hypothetical protein